MFADIRNNEIKPAGTIWIWAGAGDLLCIFATGIDKSPKFHSDVVLLIVLADLEAYPLLIRFGDIIFHRYVTNFENWKELGDFSITSFFLAKTSYRVVIFFIPRWVYR